MLYALPQAEAQIILTSPQDRVVFQRNGNNQHTLQVSGYVQSCVDRIEYRLVPLSSSSSGPVLGTAAPATGWQEVSGPNICSNFTSSLTVSGGWYRLEARGIKAGQVTTTSSVDHVGVGEVFVVAGQSNSTGGDHHVSGPGAQEDAVSSVNFQNVPIKPYEQVQLPCYEYVHLNQDTKTAPFGNYAWCWGSFGDKMVQKLGVPVMIFNSGWSSTGLWNWKESIDFHNPLPTVTPWGYAFPQGLPFGHLRLALNNYIAQLGVRAVLWHQGESDNVVERTKAQYYDDLKEVIDASRSLSGKPNLPWLVARASRFTVNGTSRVWPPVIEAQNALSGMGLPEEHHPYVYPGPDTDPYFSAEYRSDSVHFSGPGLEFLAQQWANSLDEAFFLQAPAYEALPQPQIVSDGNGSTPVLMAQAGWSAYDWMDAGDCHVPLASGQQYAANPGLLKLKATDAYNNIVYTPSYFIPSTALPVTLAYFKAEAQENKSVALSWSTTHETNADYFQIERGTDPNRFTALTQVAAQGESHKLTKYNFFDQEFLQAPTPIQYYYRLKMVDKDGSWSYSRIANALIGDYQPLLAYPNPAQNFLIIETSSPTQSIEIYNSKGQIVRQFQSVSYKTKIDLSTLSEGLYSVRAGRESYNFIKTSY